MRVRIKPLAGRTKNPVTGKTILIGCAAAAKWLGLSPTTVRFIALGREDYAEETAKRVRREFPALCGIETISGHSGREEKGVTHE